MREFETGATRDDDTNKLDFEAFLSAPVLLVYAQYLHKHRKQADGKMRAGDNWQRGIPLDEYMKSKWRHFMDTWLHHRGYSHLATNNNIVDCLCAELFNTMGYLHEILIKREQSNKKISHFPIRYPSLLDLSKKLSEE